MMININTTNGQFYYDLFYLLAILFAGIFFLIAGKRRNYPLVDLLLIYLFAIVFLIVGTKVFTYSPSDWKKIFYEFSFPYTEKKTILGAIVGGVVGIYFSKKILKFNKPILDLFAVSLPMAMSIQRVGCLMVGCCYGTPTDLPWGISYSNHAAVFHNQVHEKLISINSLTSLPIHPNQLYQIVFCLIIALVVAKNRNKFKAEGNLFGFSVVLYCIARFFVEFWRDSYTNGVAGNFLYGVKYVQWGLLAAILVCSIFIILREKNYNFKNDTKEYKSSSKLFVIGILLLSVFAFKLWFTSAEFLYILVIAFPTILFILYQIYLGEKEHKQTLRYIYLTFTFVLFSGILLGQKTYEELTENDGDRNSYTEVFAGYGANSYLSRSERMIAYRDSVWNSTDGCSAGYYKYFTNYKEGSPKYTNKSAGYNIGASHTFTYGKYNKINLRGGYSTANHKIANNSQKIKSNNILLDVKLDSKWVGVTLGAGFGKFVEENKDERKGSVTYATGALIGEQNSTISTGIDNYYYTTSKRVQLNRFNYGIRLFPLHIAYIEVASISLMPNLYTNYRVQNMGFSRIVIGSGLGLKNGTAIEIGHEKFLGTFATFKAIIMNSYGISATYCISPDEKYTKRMSVVSLIYRFNKKHWKI